MKKNVISESQQDDLQQSYAKALLATLPPSFKVCFFTSSGSEANDVALQLAHLYTQKKGVVVMENAFHGCVSSVADVSPKIIKTSMKGKNAHLHVLPLPDMYRGKYAAQNDAALKYFEEAKAVIDRGIKISGEIGCFISEPVFIVQGAVIPPHGWLKNIYSYIRELGGVVIADEIQTGMGRSGSHFWSFQTQDVVPDILVVGKPIANGHPLAAVITNHKIANCIKALKLRLSCDPVSAAIGLAVLETLHTEQLLKNAFNVGEYFHSKLSLLKQQYDVIGDIRRVGLMVGVDIVFDSHSRKPSSQLAEKISYKMKQQRVLVGNEGEYRNVLVFAPPLCCTAQDMDTVCQALEKTLAQVQIEDAEEDIYESLRAQPGSSQERFFAASSAVPAAAEPRYFSDSSDDEDIPSVDYTSLD